MTRRLFPLFSQSSAALGGAVHPGGPVPGRNRTTSSAKAALLALVAALSLLSSIGASFAQVPAPVPALPDSERRTAYSITSSTCTCNVNFQLFGDTNDFQNWVEVFLNGTRVNFNDATFGWTITSPSGSLSSLARPITDAVLTFTNPQTGTVQIVGARRPRRTSQFQENSGVPTRNFNVVLSDIISQNREIWDKTNDMTGRGLFGLPGETLSPLPSAASRAGGILCFDGTGLIPQICAPLSGTGNVVGPNSATDGHLAVFNGPTGQIIRDGGAAPAPGYISALSAANVSGSAQGTTGSISASSPNLFTVSALDFKNGQGIRINHAGTASGLTAPTGLTVTPTGTTGATTYGYTVVAFTAAGGYGPAASGVGTASGNATLSATNYNALAWSAVSGAVGYAVYTNGSGGATPFTLLAFVSGTTFFDMGTTQFASQSVPDWMPAVAPTVAAANWLVTTIASGGGTTSLTMANAATTAATTQGIFHDDTVALQAALTSATSNNQSLNLGGGIYRISSALTGVGPLQIYANGPSVGLAPGTIVLTSPTQDGFDIVGNYIKIHDLNFIGGSGTSSGQIAGSLINFPSGSGADWIYNINSQFAFNGISSNSGGGPFYIYGNLLSGYGSLINLSNGGDSSYYANELAPISVPGATNGIGFFLGGDPGGARIWGNKINGGGNGYAVGIDVIITAADGDLMIFGNSIEQFNVAGIEVDRQGTPGFANININHNQMTGIGRAVYFPDTTNFIGQVNISDNVLDASGPSVIDFEALSSVMVGGNVLTGNGIGIRIGTASTKIMIGTNVFNAVAPQIQDASGVASYAAVTNTQPTYP
jgi:hypothetical protein